MRFYDLVILFIEAFQLFDVDEVYAIGYGCFFGLFKNSVGDSKQIILKGYDYNKNIIDLTSANITYEITDTTVATVNENGVITYKKAGTTNLKITATLNGFTAKVTYTIESL